MSARFLATSPPPGGGVARHLLRAADGAALLSGGIAVLCLVGLLLLILIEVGMAALGKVFAGLSYDLNVGWEYSAYLMGSVFLFGAAAGLRAGSHVRVSILLARAEGAAHRALEVLATLVGLGVAGFLTWALFNFTQRSWVNDQLSSGSLTPLWIPNAALTMGAALLALQMAARLLRVLLGLPPEDTTLQAGSGE